MRISWRVLSEKVRPSANVQSWLWGRFTASHPCAGVHKVPHLKPGAGKWTPSLLTFSGGLSSISQNILSTAPSTCFFVYIFTSQTSGAIWGTQLKQRESEPWGGYSLSYQDKLSLRVDVHSPGGVHQAKVREEACDVLYLIDPAAEHWH